MMIDTEKYTLKLDSWHTPATDYPEKEIGDYRIHHGRYNRGTYEMSGIDDHIVFEVTKPIPITSLQQRRGKRWHGWMVDDPPHWRAMEIYAEQSTGAVLTSGLGLGLIVFGLIKNPKVTKIVVVERSAEVALLVSRHLPESDKLTIVIGDFYDYLEVDKTEWDTIMVDLWVSHGAEEKLELYFHEVIPTAVDLKERYPKASLTFHGFITASDIKFTSQEMADLIIKMKGGRKR